MTNTKHTPGPWVARKGKLTWFVEKFGNHIFPRICLVDGLDSDQEATAKLLAAAPDLLSACESCLLRDDIADSELGDLLRAAIARARGVAV